jgi:hypothetical protein
MTERVPKASHDAGGGPRVFSYPMPARTSMEEGGTNPHKDVMPR